jgi:serine/threonine-protein kinase
MSRRYHGGPRIRYHRGLSRRLAPGAKLAQYKIVRLLGEGGMGAVYEALDESLDRHVAIKTLLSEVAQDQESRRRFFREGKAAAKLRHPHVVEVYGVGIEEEVPYLVMELLSGESLASLLDREKKLPTERTVDVLLPVLSALVVAHQEGVIHRDLKPDNIFLQTTRAKTVVPKLLDFGISKVTGMHNSRITHTSALMGTPYYMSPEQARGSKDVDAQIDQWAIGVILYECLAGERPIQGETVLEILHRIATAPIKPLRIAAPEVPDELAAVIMRALEREPDARWPSMVSLARALLPFASPASRATWTAAFAGPLSDRPPPPPSPSEPPTSEAAPPRASASEAVTVAARAPEPQRPSQPVGATTGAARKTGSGITRNLEPQGDPRSQTGPIAVPASRTGVVALGAAAVVVALLGIAVAFGGGGEASATASAASSPTPPSSPEGVPAREPVAQEHAIGEEVTPPATFEARIEASPAEASIEIDGVIAARGSWRASLPLDGRPHVARVFAEGYQERRLAFTDAPPPREVVLARLAPEPTSARPAGSPRSSPRAQGTTAPPRTPTSSPASSAPTLGANAAPILE